ncbi:AraC family transcriptional regulator [Muricoccus radiodurans]|uniref:AraC family transcriptional regulator n=1 Tax=Muricoccus radiodurans TaxID=2231721 RepID=UPI003CF6AD69
MDRDILSDVLQAVRLKGALFYLVEAAPPWVVTAPSAQEVAAAVMPGCDHVMEFHAFFEGECWGGPLDHPQERIRAGEIILFPRGDPHVFRSAPDIPPPPPTMSRQGSVPIRLRLGGSGAPAARFVCGFLGCDARPFNPLIEALPRMLRIPAQEGPLDALMRLAVAETTSPRAGGEALRARLAEMMFVEAVRTHLAALPDGTGGWLGGLRDPQVGRVLGLLHGQPAHPWALDDLAREAGLSRTVLHERFAALVGHPPMQYLARWRMQLAASRLAQGSDKVVSIAMEVGYESEAAFNRAFKRLLGMPPAAWRRERGARA